MKNKGFTLIELLAVILILGVIALIAVPTVTNIIKDAKMSSFKATVQNVISTAEQQCQLDELNGREMVDFYTFEDGVVDPLLSLKGELPNNGTITLNNDCIVTSVNVSSNEYTALLNGDVLEIKEGVIQKYDAYVVGQIITMKDNSNWIVVENSDGDNPTLKLLSPFNIFHDLNSSPSTDLYVEEANRQNYYIAYNLSGSNVWNNSTLKSYLDNTVKGIIQATIEIPIESVSILGIDDLTKLGCVITGNETNGVSGINCDNTSSWYTKVFEISSSWLKIPSSSNSIHAWTVKNDGTFAFATVYNTADSGVRPVITILKEKL